MFAPRPPGSPDFAFPIQCNWLKSNGSWPVHNTNSYFAEFYHYWSIFVICLVGATCAFQMWYMFDNFGDILKVTENCCTSFMGLHTFLRLIHMWLNKREMKQLMRDFVDHIFVVKGTDLRIEKECHKELRVYRVMSIMSFALICMYCVMPLFELFADFSAAERPFPYKMVFPYPAQRGIAYIVTYIYTSFAGFVAVTTLFAEDSLFGFFITYACGQFQVLHRRIEKLIPIGFNSAVQKYGKSRITKKLVQLEYYVQLQEIIQKHNILIRFCTDLDRFCSPIFLVNFTISSVLICVVGFQIVTARMSLANFSKFLLYIFSALSQLFIICWSGDKLISNSTKTAWKLYTCNWEGDRLSPNHYENSELDGKFDDRRYFPCDTKCIKSLFFMILRAQKPLRITALKFSVLSLQSFTKILSTSMSYFTLLQTMYEEE